MAEQKYALVTGGNRGIGLEVCKKLVQCNKPVILTARTTEAAEQAKQQLLALSNGIDVQAFTLQAADASSVSGLVKELQQYEIDLLVNNAGVSTRGVWDEATYNETLAVDVTGPLSLTQQLAPLMPSGSLVIMVSSGAGESSCLAPDYLEKVKAISDLQQLHDLHTSVPFVADSPQGHLPDSNMGSWAPTYSVAKALLNKAVQLLAAPGSYLQEKGINCVAVCPGWCRTDMGTDEAGRSGEQGADSVLHPWLNWKPELNGSFTRDGGALDW